MSLVKVDALRHAMLCRIMLVHSPVSISMVVMVVVVAILATYSSKMKTKYVPPNIRPNIIFTLTNEVPHTNEFTLWPTEFHETT